MKELLVEIIIHFVIHDLAEVCSQLYVLRMN